MDLTLSLVMGSRTGPLSEFIKSVTGSAGGRVRFALVPLRPASGFGWRFPRRKDQMLFQAIGYGAPVLALSKRDTESVNGLGSRDLTG